jgi:MFS superfamily sulfate permease-like transporter
MNSTYFPPDGWRGLQRHWKNDALAGFLVFLLALPLSLGIAKASEFPPAMGVLTAMIGGLFVSFFAGSRLTIKGPAAGLITICAGAVTEMGGGTEGWHLALGAIVVAAGLQIVFGLLKFGSLSDFFPHSAVHGMLAAIGLIIFSKQIHVLLGIDPATLKGLEPIELYERIPHSVLHADPRVTLVGIISLLIIFGMPFLKNPLLKKVPAPMIVLAVTIPLAWTMDFKHTEPAFDMVKIGDFWANVGLNVSFGMIGSWVFWKYVLMFLFINSLESLLTVKAIDGLDPWKRESNFNKDLMAVGAGNALSGMLGGLPMISEVARSSANVNFGGHTRWANFFHGLFLLVAMLLFIPVIEMIPNTALAALLIAVGYRLASPNEFFKTYKIGAEQLIIFVVTIIVTISTDLLMGVGAGILMKFIFHVINGVPVRSLFKAHYEFVDRQGTYFIKFRESAIFSNLLGFKKALQAAKPGKKVVLDFTESKMIDHTFMEMLHHFEETYQHQGGTVMTTGFDRFKPFSNHPLAARKYSPEAESKIEIKLTPRQLALRDLAEREEFIFYPARVKNGLKYKGFPIQHGGSIQFEENVLTCYTENAKIELADLSLVHGALQEQRETTLTVLLASDLELNVPDFALEPEGLWTKMSDIVFGSDIDFPENASFSDRYDLRSNDPEAVRALFQPDVLAFLANREEIHIECHRHKLLLFKKRDLVEPQDMVHLRDFALDFIAQLQTKRLV